MTSTNRPPYPPEFRAEAVRLVRSGQQPLAATARDLGVSVESLRAWTKRSDVDEGRRDGLTTDERAELARLRREVRVLQQEREILRKAAAFFARESENR
jgi:transposase